MGKIKRVVSPVLFDFFHVSSTWSQHCSDQSFFNLNWLLSSVWQDLVHNWVRKDDVQQLEHKSRGVNQKHVLGTKVITPAKTPPATGNGTNLTKLKTLTDLHFFFRIKVFLISTMSLRGHAMTGKREKNVIFPPEPPLQLAGLKNLQGVFLVEGKGDRSYRRHLSQNLSTNSAFKLWFSIFINYHIPSMTES